MSCIAAGTKHENFCLEPKFLGLGVSVLNQNSLGPKYVPYGCLDLLGYQSPRMIDSQSAGA